MEKGVWIMVLVFAFAGLLAAIVLSIIDFVTSYQGVKAVMPPGNESAILMSIPPLFAVLALTFNGVSAHLFRHFRRGRYGGFATLVLFLVWLNFLSWDWITSFAGITSEFAGGPLGTVEHILAAFNNLTSAQKYVAVVIAALASSGPFLASAFADLIKEQDSEQD